MTSDPAAPAGRLSLVATPIGNLEDLTFRALRVLKSADLVAAEDTRRTLKLLNHYQISVPLVSYYQEIERRRGAELLRRLQAGQHVALVTDAGTPGVSDPGQALVALALEAGVAVEIVPGASAVLTALVGSGLSAEPFSFHGFLANRSGERRRQIEALRDRTETLVLFAPPHRLRAVLADLAAVLGKTRPAALARELTKLHEEFLRGTLGELEAQMLAREPLGEFTLVIGGNPAGASAPSPVGTVSDRVAFWQQQGFSLNQAARRAAKELGLDPRTVYAETHGCKKEPDK